MEERFSLAGGKGRLTVWEENGRAVCKAHFPDDNKGLYKCWLSGPGGKALLGRRVQLGGQLRHERSRSGA